MIKCVFTLVLFSIMSTSLVLAQDTTVLKRTPYKLKVVVDKKTFYEEELAEKPYVLPGNTIQIYPGEKIFIEIEQEDGVVKNIKAVKEVKDPAKTVTISFTQTVNKKVHELMILSVSNPFSARLSYKASIYLLKQQKWVNTSIYPVEPGLSGFETWPDIITSIVLSDWTLKK